MVATEHSPKSGQDSRMQNTEHSTTSKNDEPLKDMVDDSNSQNKSATSQGTGLANKIGLAISRILANTSNSRTQENEDEVADLVALIKELNHHTELTVRLSSTNKISKILNEVGTKKDIFAEIQSNKVVGF